MEYKNTKSWVERARTIDEPYVIMALENYGINAKQGDVIDDWNHIDLFADIEGRKYFIDVKRNHGSQAASPNFTFTFINSKNQEFTYRENGYFAFINDVTGEVYLIKHYILQDLVRKSKHFASKFKPNEQYIIVPKSTIKRYSDIILSGDKSFLR